MVSPEFRQTFTIISPEFRAMEHVEKGDNHNSAFLHALYYKSTNSLTIVIIIMLALIVSVSAYPISISMAVNIYHDVNSIMYLYRR